MSVQAGDTNHSVAMSWAAAQAKYISGPHFKLLVVLVDNAFYTTKKHKDENREDAPVGQVLKGYSGIGTLAKLSGLSKSTVATTLWDLQDMGYIIRTDRPKRPGERTPPSIIRIYWTDKADTTRMKLWRGEATLPEKNSSPRPSKGRKKQRQDPQAVALETIENYGG